MPALPVEPAALFELATGPGRPIGRRLTLFESDGRRAVYLGPTAIHVYDAADKQAEAPVDDHNHALAALRYLISRLQPWRGCGEGGYGSSSAA